MSKGLARIMLDKTIAKATDTIELMEKLEGEATDPELKGYLSLCLCFYVGAVEDYFQKSLENLDTNSFLGLHVMEQRRLRTLHHWDLIAPQLYGRRVKI